MKTNNDLHFLPEKLRHGLMPFQRAGIVSAIQKHGRCLIADEMGLGKTLQALSVAYYYKEEWPMLIVVPSSLKYPWIEEIEKWFPDIHPHDINPIMTGNDINDISVSPINIVTYGLIRNNRGGLLIEALFHQKFNIVILDESHYIKNRLSVSSKVLVPLVQRALRRILISGTPALSRPAELYAQLDALCYGDFMTWTAFAQRYCDAKYENIGRVRKWNTSGASNLNELQMKLQKVMIRRLKENVLKQLPPKQRQKISFEIKESNYRKDVEASWNKLTSVLDKLKLGVANFFEPCNAESDAFEMKKLIHTLYRQTCLAKIGPVVEYVKILLEDDTQKILIFAYHHDMMDAIQRQLWDSKVGFIRIDGATPPPVRPDLVHSFQTDPNIRVAVLSILAAGVGLTFTASSLVVFAELYWTPGVLIQCEDRAHRIGQKSTVNIHYLVARSTVDEWVWSAVSKKNIVITTTLNGQRQDLSIKKSNNINQIARLSNADVWIPPVSCDADRDIKFFETEKKDNGQLLMTDFLNGNRPPGKKKTCDFNQVITIDSDSDSADFKSVWKPKKVSSKTQELPDIVRAPRKKPILASDNIAIAEPMIESFAEDSNNSNKSIEDGFDSADDYELMGAVQYWESQNTDTVSRNSSLVSNNVSDCSSVIDESNSSSFEVHNSFVFWNDSDLTETCSQIPGTSHKETPSESNIGNFENSAEDEELVDAVEQWESSFDDDIKERMPYENMTESQASNSDNKFIQEIALSSVDDDCKAGKEMCNVNSNNVSYVFNRCTGTSQSSGATRKSTVAICLNVKDKYTCDSPSKAMLCYSTNKDSMHHHDSSSVITSNESKSNCVSSGNSSAARYESNKDISQVIFQRKEVLDTPSSRTTFNKDNEDSAMHFSGDENDSDNIESDDDSLSSAGMSNVLELVLSSDEEEPDICITPEDLAYLDNINVLTSDDDDCSSEQVIISESDESLTVDDEITVIADSGDETLVENKDEMKKLMPPKCIEFNQKTHLHLQPQETSDNSKQVLSLGVQYSTCDKKRYSMSKISECEEKSDICHGVSLPESIKGDLVTSRAHYKSLQNLKIMDNKAMENLEEEKMDDDVDCQRNVILDDMTTHSRFLYCLSKNTSRVYLFDMDGTPLNSSFLPLDVEAENFSDLPDLLLHPKHLCLVKTFCAEWNSLSLTKRKVVSRAGSLFTSPLRCYEDVRQKPVSKQRYTTKADVAESAITAAQEAGGSVRIIHCPKFNSKKSLDERLKGLCQVYPIPDYLKKLITPQKRLQRVVSGKIASSRSSVVKTPSSRKRKTKTPRSAKNASPIKKERLSSGTCRSLAASMSTPEKLDVASVLPCNVSPIQRDPKRRKTLDVTKQMTSVDDSDDKRYEETNSGYMQAVDNSGVPLCINCQKPVSSHTSLHGFSLKQHNASTSWQTRFCSRDCSNQHWMKSSREYGRQAVYEVERGVCQICHFKAELFFTQIKITKDLAKRVELISKSPYSVMKAEIKDKMVKNPYRGQFWHVDHIQAVMDGGGQCDVDNLRTLCVLCHQKVTTSQKREAALKRKKLHSNKFADLSNFFKPL